MTNLTLAPEDDDSPTPNGDRLTPVRPSLSEATGPTEVQRLRAQFDPQKVGFGILAPWPGTQRATNVRGWEVLELLYPNATGKERQ